MAYSEAELAQRQRFEDFYSISQSPALLSLERAVCGCDYGGNSWTTEAEAERIAALLELRPGLRLLDVGAGAGWPGLRMAAQSGCDLVLADLPLAGMRVASQRAQRDGLAERCALAVADAAILPFQDASFDAVSHSDLLCCLRPKRAVLEACRRVIRPGGRMAFTVISITPGLSREDHARAVENGPEFIESDTGYPTLLAETGWRLVESRDISAQYADSCRRTIEAEEERKDDLESLLGAETFAERHATWPPKLAAIEDGLIRRDRFLAVPRPS